MKTIWQEMSQKINKWEDDPSIIIPFCYLLFAMLIFIVGNGAFASGLDLKQGIVCQTMNGDKTFILKNNSIAFDADESENERKISSISEVKTIRLGKSLTKLTKRLGLKYRVHIADISNPSIVDDFVSITSHDGHEITYPISCE